ncbi:C69 family dipeptidase [Desulfovibrio sp. ZJ200]|uniref:dipeptidase n=1 Tax=Desulfovibrio sp. ZJ200 TaxID=2709792 RepID=UPI001F14BC3F|nr:C69 family dipeptidase [Desulfovibrio sp. ZJ200]
MKDKTTSSLLSSALPRYMIRILAIFLTATLLRGTASAEPLRLPPMPKNAACTTTIVTPGASSDGSMLVSHSDDNDLGDQSIVFVPARDWPEGSLRPVYASAVAVGDQPQFNAFLVPRLVDKNRAPGYANPGNAPSIPIGHIPQAVHTYAYIDGNYGIMNEHGLMFGECTDGAFISNGPEPGKRIFYSAELSRVALERCRTAREAVALMGQLIETYGYYGTGETLPVADGKEAWIMEMAPSPEGTGGLWVAQRVPDGHFWVAANEFRIRDLVPGNPDQMWGKSLMGVIERAGWRSPKDASLPVDWLVSVSHGEYNHPYYSLRRVWRALSLAAPSAGLPAWVESGSTRAYPFSIRPDRKMNVEDVKRIHRDHYEGTEFDLTKGVAAGPFGSPERYLGPYDPHGDVGDPKAVLNGAWERPISMYYTGYVYICQWKPHLPAPLAGTLWLALDRPAESVFVPLTVGPLPKGYEKGDTRAFSRDSAWWSYNLVGNYAQLKYSYMIRDIQARAALNEAEGVRIQDTLEDELAELASSAPHQAAAQRNQRFNAYAEAVRADWGKLFEFLVAKYAQGFVNTPDKMAQTVGYPQEWLDKTDYSHGPARGYAKDGK